MNKSLPPRTMDDLQSVETRLDKVETIRDLGRKALAYGGIAGEETLLRKEAPLTPVERAQIVGKVLRAGVKECRDCQRALRTYLVREAGCAKKEARYE